MICVDCRRRDHRDCPGGTWCDCQHQPRPGQPDGTADAEPAHGAEPALSWVRQG